MFDLEKFGGNFKGTIAECMFKLTNKRVVVTKFFNKGKYFNIFGGYFNNEQKKFFEENWYSIDAIEIKFENGKKKIILYEIKSKSAYYAKKIKKWPLKITANTYEIYKYSQGIGFEPKLALVWFLKDWKFDIQIQEFESVRWSIDKPKKYDKKTVVPPGFEPGSHAPKA